MKKTLDEFGIKWKTPVLCDDEANESFMVQ